MPGINQAAVGDGYTAAATVQDVFTSTGGWFAVSAQPVVIQLQWGPNASGSRWSDEQTLGVGAFGTIPPGATGIRFRNLTPGSAATVTAYIGSGGPPPDPRGNVWPEPALAISAIGSVNTSGRAPTRTVITAAGAGTYNTPTACIAILVECLGGGGGGGGSRNNGATQVSPAGSGGGGAYSASLIAAPASAYAYSVGAGGTAGPAGAGGVGGNGGNGGDTTFGVAIVVAKGGLGGSGQTILNPPFAQIGSAGGDSAAGVGTIKVPGGAATAHIGATGTDVQGGNGGAGAVYGSQTLGAQTSTLIAGNNATAPGSGGTGGLSCNGNVGTNGGTGAAGLLVITEFY